MDEDEYGNRSNIHLLFILIHTCSTFVAMNVVHSLLNNLKKKRSPVLSLFPVILFILKYNITLHVKYTQHVRP